MAARSTMASLITHVRELTNAQTSDFSDNQVQAFLDQHRVEYRYLPLCPLPTRAAGGVLQYKTFVLELLSPRRIEGNEGSDPDAYQLVDNTYEALTPATEDLVNGRWTFAAEPSRPVMIVCYAYDCFAAAVALLEQWAAKLRTTGDKVLTSFEDNGQKFEWKATTTSLQTLIDTYRAQMCAVSVVIIDSDHMPW